MKKKEYEGYRISGNKVTHMKLTSLSLPENETLSMIRHYCFDEENTQRMLDEAERIREEFIIRQEQKEYKEKNYDAIYRRLSNYSTFELLKELFSCIKGELQHYKE